MQRGKSAVFKIQVHIPAATTTWMSTLIWTFIFSKFIEHLLYARLRDRWCASKGGGTVCRAPTGWWRAGSFDESGQCSNRYWVEDIPGRNGKVNPEGVELGRGGNMNSNIAHVSCLAKLPTSSLKDLGKCGLNLVPRAWLKALHAISTLTPPFSFRFFWVTSGGSFGFSSFS